MLPIRVGPLVAIMPNASVGSREAELFATYAWVEWPVICIFLVLRFLLLGSVTGMCTRGIYGVEALVDFQGIFWVTVIATSSGTGIEFVSTGIVCFIGHC